jgi:uncharacterized protein (TIGR02246 family)
MSVHDDSIRQLWSHMERGWASGSAEQFAAPFTDSAAFVSVRGEEQRGRAEIARRHAVLFAGPYSGTVLTAAVEAIRYLRPDLALVHARSAISGSTGPVTVTHAQALAEHRDGRWQIVAFHNMVPVQPAPPTPAALAPAATRRETR